MRHEALYHAKYQTLEATSASAMTALLRIRGLINLNCLRHLPAFDAPDDDNP